MITITLNKIKKQGPCNKGWKILLKSKSGLDYNEPFPLSDILDSNGLEDALWALRCIPEYSKLWRKYAVWCARQILHLMEDPRSINALNVAWRHSRGEIVETALDAASDAAWDAALDATSDPALAAAEAAALATTSAITSDASSEAASGAASDAAMAAASAAAWYAGSLYPLWAAQTAKLRQISDAGDWVE